MLIKLYEMAGKDPNGRWWNDATQFRKVGHVIEYFILGISAQSLFKRMSISILVCAIISMTDQLAKIYIPKRHFDVSDLPFDVIGYISAILIVFVLSTAVELWRKT